MRAPRVMGWSLRKTVLWLVLLAAGAFVLIAGWVLHLSRVYSTFVFDARGVMRALIYYMEASGGDLPSGPSSLVSSGVINVRSNGRWVVHSRPSRWTADILNESWEVVHPEWFDISWGLTAPEIAALEEGALLVRPSAELRLVRPTDVCGIMSQQLRDFSGTVSDRSVTSARQAESRPASAGSGQAE